MRPPRLLPGHRRALIAGEEMKVVYPGLVKRAGIVVPDQASGRNQSSDRPPNYPEALERDVVCAENTTVRIRPIRPDDSQRLDAFHQRLDPYSIYLRFFTFHPALS